MRFKNITQMSTRHLFEILVCLDIFYLQTEALSSERVTVTDGDRRLLLHEGWNYIIIDLSFHNRFISS
jgi:hypothetical protein